LLEYGGDRIHFSFVGFQQEWNATLQDSRWDEIFTVVTQRDYVAHFLTLCIQENVLQLNNSIVVAELEH